MSGQHVVIVTGGRSYPEELRPVVYSNLRDQYILHGPFVLFHGACQPRGSSEMTGADRYADDWAQIHPDVDLRPRPADWDARGDQAGPARNWSMVQEALTLAPASRILGLAFPEPGSRGTWNCVRHMKDAYIHVEEWNFRRAREWLTEWQATG